MRFDGSTHTLLRGLDFADELPACYFDGQPWLHPWSGNTGTLRRENFLADCDAKARARGGRFEASCARDFILLRFVHGKRRVREPHETVVHHSRSGFGFSIGAVR